MKPGIHPQYHQAKVTCACGNTFTVGSVLETIEVEICSACHPFYTGTQKFIDTKGRIEKFQDRVEKGKVFHANKAAVAATKKASKSAKTKKSPKSL